MNQVVKIPKIGKSIDSTSPNDYIFHSSYNTFKIIKEGSGDITYTGDGYYSISHDISNYNPTSFMLFLKFPDGFVACVVGTGRTDSKDGTFTTKDMYINTTQIKIYITRNSGSETSLSYKYYIFETPLS